MEPRTLSSMAMITIAVSILSFVVFVGWSVGWRVVGRAHTARATRRKQIHDVPLANNDASSRPKQKPAKKKKKKKKQTAPRAKPQSKPTTMPKQQSKSKPKTQLKSQSSPSPSPQPKQKSKRKRNRKRRAKESKETQSSLRCDNLFTPKYAQKCLRFIDAVAHVTL